MKSQWEILGKLHTRHVGDVMSSGHQDVTDSLERIRQATKLLHLGHRIDRDNQSTLAAPMPTEARPKATSLGTHAGWVSLLRAHTIRKNRTNDISKRPRNVTIFQPWPVRSRKECSAPGRMPLPSVRMLRCSNPARRPPPKIPLTLRRPLPQ